ncbi:MAG: divergent PAP2 family protein [Candidatus Omnitrophica bacterium]|nr:divergent PAP2 family protein [Candidatus Omnitrophota bacterium]
MDTTQDILKELAKNKILFITVYTWAITQTLKVLTGVVREKKFNFRWLIGTGGMPSSHAATVSGMATAVGLSVGFDSAMFVVALVFAIIVIFDAQGVRRASGKQAEVLNKMLDDIYWKKHIQEDRLKELLGHTPVEVLVGIASGIIFALLLWRAYYGG